MRKSSVNASTFAQHASLSPNNDRTGSVRNASKFFSEKLPNDMVKQAKYMVEQTHKSWTVMSRKGASDVVVSDENLADMTKRGYTVVKRFEYKPSRKELLESFNLYLDKCNEEEVSK